MRISQAIKLLQAWQDQIGDVPLTTRERFLTMEGDYEVNLFPQVCEIGLLAKPVGDRIFLAIDGGGIRLGKVIEFEEIFVRDESPNHEG